MTLLYEPTQDDALQVEATDNRVVWLERNYGLKFSAEQRRCIAVLSALGAPYALTFRKTNPIDAKFKEALHVALSTHRLCTVDFDGMTELVIRAHAYSVRVDISASSTYYMRISLFARPPGNSSRLTMHPTLDALAQRAYAAKNC